MTCRLVERDLPGKAVALSMENSLVKIVVLPGRGADISEFTHKPSGVNFLFVKVEPSTVFSGRGLPSSTPDSQFYDRWSGGWQELFPNAGGSCTYKGAELPFHGEVLYLPWEYEVEARTQRELRVLFSVRTLRTPFRLEKMLILERGSPTLVIKERVTNEGHEAAAFMWGYHPAFGGPFLDGPCRVHIPARRVRRCEDELVAGVPQRIPGDMSFGWPHAETLAGEKIDLSRLMPKGAGRSELCYVDQLEEGWYAIVNETSRLMFAMTWPLSTFPYVWLWQESGGNLGFPWYGRYHIVGVEPQSSSPAAGLQHAIEARTAPELQPGGSLDIEVHATVTELKGELERVSAEGIPLCRR